MTVVAKSGDERVAAIIMSLLSKAQPKVVTAAFRYEEVEELTAMIRDASTEVVEPMAGVASATLSMAYAAARFLVASPSSDAHTALPPLDWIPSRMAYVG